MDDVKIGIIGGSGLYEIEGMEFLKEIEIETPFGFPSDKIMIGKLGDHKIAFLPRHGRGHQFNPTNIPARANIWALKSLGVFWVISVSAVGSLQEQIAPRHFVIPDQVIDRTRHRKDTFFQDLAVHTSFSHPFHPMLRSILHLACTEAGAIVHNGGTYVCMEGPLFSTKAESAMHRNWGASIIGMTALPEAKLAREAEMCYASICLATDYDVWHEDEHVDIPSVMENVKANISKVKQALKLAIPMIPFEKEKECDASRALEFAIMTRHDLIPEHAWDEVGLFLKKYIRRDHSAHSI